MALTNVEHKQQLNNLLTIVNHYCPTGRNQKAFVKLVHSMEDQHEPPANIMRAVVGGFYDGLAYGNWPE